MDISDTGCRSSSLVAKDGGNVVFLLGAPRSGTTWLAKIFDSHPDVVYRHEPDTVVRSKSLPVLCPRDKVAAYRDEAKDYVLRLMDVRTQKSAGSLPIFPKSYQGALSQAARAAFVFGPRVIERATGAKWPREIAIPDFVRASSRKPVVVMKSVSSRGRARLFAEALPASRILFILRHPCGQVASMMVGINKGKFEGDARLREILETEEAVLYGLTGEIFDALTQAEKCAWHWAILNQKALNDLAGLARVMTVRYEDLCRQPEIVSHRMFDFAGLSWNAQTADFLHKSATGSDTSDYFKTTRNSLAAAEKWRSELSAEDQERVLRIARRVPVGDLALAA